MTISLKLVNLPLPFPICRSCSKEKLEEKIASLHRDMEARQGTIEDTTARLQR